MFNALEETTSYVLVYDKSEGQITASDLLFVIVPYLVHDIVISRIRSQFMSHCMTVVALLAGATGKTGDGKWYGNRKGDGMGTGDMVQKQKQDGSQLVEILFTNNESGLTMILFMN